MQLKVGQGLWKITPFYTHIGKEEDLWRCRWMRFTPSLMIAFVGIFKFSVCLGTNGILSLDEERILRSTEPGVLWTWVGIEEKSVNNIGSGILGFQILKCFEDRS